MRKQTLSSVVPITLLTLFGCGGGGGGGAGAGGASTGLLLDSAVGGVDYTVNGDTRVTGPNGNFEYTPGAQVTFGIGGIVLGTVQGAPRVTLVDLVSGANDETNIAVTNMARLLQTLDADADPSNGIDIPPAVRLAAAGLPLEFNQVAAEFENDPTLAAALAAVGSGGLVSAQQARQHLAGTLLGLLAGEYSGSFDGCDSGSFKFFVDIDGNIIGYGVDSASEFFSFSGDSDSDGTGVFGNVSTGATFSGTLAGGSVSGTWDNTFEQLNGSFSGSQTTAVGTIDLGIVAQIAGQYSGTVTFAGGGSETFDVVLNAAGLLLLGNASETTAALLSTDANGASFSGLDDEGTEIRGRLEINGELSATLTNPITGESGSATGTKSSSGT